MIERRPGPSGKARQKFIKNLPPFCSLLEETDRNAATFRIRHSRFRIFLLYEYRPNTSFSPSFKSAKSTLHTKWRFRVVVVVVDCQAACLAWAATAWILMIRA